MVEQNTKINETPFLENDNFSAGESFLSILDKRKKSKENELAECEESFSHLYCHQVFLERSAGGGGKNFSGGMMGHLSPLNNHKHFYSLTNSKSVDSAILNRISKSLSVQQSMNASSPKENKINQENSEGLDRSQKISTGLIKPGGYTRSLEDKEEIAVAKSYSPVSFFYEDAVSADKKNFGNGEMLHQTLSNTQQFIRNSISAGDPSVEPGVTQNCDLEYQFQRWNGDHSVRVSIPTELSRDGMIKLMPSDMRVADALSKNMDGKLYLVPDVLMQQQKKDGREHHHAEEEEE